jgi:hypothetical protein
VQVLVFVPPDFNLARVQEFQQPAQGLVRFGVKRQQVAPAPQAGVELTKGLGDLAAGKLRLRRVAGLANRPQLLGPRRSAQQKAHRAGPLQLAGE